MFISKGKSLLDYIPVHYYVQYNDASYLYTVDQWGTLKDFCEALEKRGKKYQVFKWTLIRGEMEQVELLHL